METFPESAIAEKAKKYPPKRGYQKKGGKLKLFLL
jgi:hypothetical protein